jgi:hypothetical protein
MRPTPPLSLINLESNTIVFEVLEIRLIRQALSLPLEQVIKLLARLGLLDNLILNIPLHHLGFRARVQVPKHLASLYHLLLDDHRL